MTKVGWTWYGNSLPSKKNSKKIIRKKSKTGKIIPLIISSDKHNAWNTLFVSDIKRLQPIYRWESAIFTIYSPDRRKFDLTNKIESIMDGMVDAGYIIDDNMDICPDVRIVYGGMTDNKQWKVVAEIELLNKK